MKRFGFLVVVITALLLVSAAGAVAGGSTWTFEDRDYRPGEIVEVTTAVSWSHHASLGTPADGPYLIYLAEASVNFSSWPPDPSGLPLVGVVEITLGPFTDSHGDRYGPHGATARFEIPDVTPGEYQIVYCNEPCTTTLGDVIGGWGLKVVDGNAGRALAVVAADVRAALEADPLLGSANHSETARREAGHRVPSRTFTPVVDEPVPVPDVPVAGLPVAPVQRAAEIELSPAPRAELAGSTPGVEPGPAPEAPADTSTGWPAVLGLGVLVLGAFGVVALRRRTPVESMVPASVDEVQSAASADSASAPQQELAGSHR